jgi:hypothetical protein
MKVPYGETRLLVVTRKPAREGYVTLGISLIHWLRPWVGRIACFYSKRSILEFKNTENYTWYSGDNTSVQAIRDDREWQSLGEFQIGKYHKRWFQTGPDTRTYSLTLHNLLHLDWNYFLMKEIPFWMLSANSFFAFCNPTLLNIITRSIFLFISFYQQRKVSWVIKCFFIPLIFV